MNLTSFYIVASGPSKSLTNVEAQSLTARRGSRCRASSFDDSGDLERSLQATAHSGGPRMAVTEEDAEDSGRVPVLELELVALDMGLHFVEVVQEVSSGMRVVVMPYFVETAHM